MHSILATWTVIISLESVLLSFRLLTPNSEAIDLVLVTESLSYLVMGECS